MCCNRTQQDLENVTNCKSSCCFTVVSSAAKEVVGEPNEMVVANAAECSPVEETDNASVAAATRPDASPFVKGDIWQAEECDESESIIS
jgi:hypothetical protein